jgi:hypothetical protein
VQILYSRKCVRSGGGTRIHVHQLIRRQQLRQIHLNTLQSCIFNLINMISDMQYLVVRQPAVRSWKAFGWIRRLTIKGSRPSYWTDTGIAANRMHDDVISDGCTRHTLVDHVHEWQREIKLSRGKPQFSENVDVNMVPKDSTTFFRQ